MDIEWLQEQIWQLQSDVRDLQNTVEELTSKSPPLVYDIKPFEIDIDPLIGVSRCSKCGMEWKGVMGYACPHTDCNMQLKIT